MPEFSTEAFRVKFPSEDPSIELAGIVDRPKDESDRSGKPVVIFSHCFTCNKDLKATVRISRALAKTGISVLRFDMRGLGGSKGDFSQSNFTTNLEDLTAAIRFAGSELGEVTGLIGHSFGGVASLVIAAKNATNKDESTALGQLGAVITLAAPSDTHHLAKLLLRMNPEIESVGHGDVTIGGITWTIRKQMLEDFRSHDVTALLPHIQCPVMLMHSPEDETLAYDHALRLMNLITGVREPRPSVSLVTLDQADHLLVKNPDDLPYVSHIMAGFLHRHSRQDPPSSK